MRDGDDGEKGLSPQQQYLLMGKVAALEQALLLLARVLPEDERALVRDLACFARDNHQATATIPEPLRSGHEVARYLIFERLREALTDLPDNDNQEE